LKKKQKGKENQSQNDKETDFFLPHGSKKCQCGCLGSGVLEKIEAREEMIFP